MVYSNEVRSPRDLYTVVCLVLCLFCSFSDIVCQNTRTLTHKSGRTMGGDKKRTLKRRGKTNFHSMGFGLSKEQVEGGGRVGHSYLLKTKEREQILHKKRSIKLFFRLP